MLAREHLWRLVPRRDGAALGRWWRPRHGYVLAVPLLLAPEAAVAVERRLRARPWREPAWLAGPSADAEEAARWRERRRAAARVRRRFRRARRAAAALGGVAATLAIGWQLAPLVAAGRRVDGAS